MISVHSVADLQNQSAPAPDTSTQTQISAIQGNSLSEAAPSQQTKVFSILRERAGGAPTLHSFLISMAGGAPAASAEKKC